MPKYGTDYTKSAINLTSTLEVRDLLLVWGKAKDVYLNAHAILEAITDKIPEALAVNEAFEAMDKAHGNVKAAIDRAGGLQDIPDGLYALKLGRISISYDPSMNL